MVSGSGSQGSRRPRKRGTPNARLGRSLALPACSAGASPSLLGRGLGEAGTVPVPRRYFTAPRVMPLVSCVWKMRNTTSTGSAARKSAAEMCGMCAVYSP